MEFVKYNTKCPVNFMQIKQTKRVTNFTFVNIHNINTGKEFQHHQDTDKTYSTENYC